MWDKIVKTLCAIGGAIAGLFGQWPEMLTILMVAMTLDYISGVIVAASGRSHKTENGGLSSKVGFIGLAKKGFIMLIVLLATLLDHAIGDSAMLFQSAAACYYIANEGLSILENAVLMDLPVPGVIKKALEELRDKGDQGDGKGGD